MTLGQRQRLKQKFTSILVPALPIAVFSGIYIMSPEWDRTLFAIGTFRVKEVQFSSFKEFEKQRKEEYTVLFFGEDTETSCAVVQKAWDENRDELILTVNGKPDATRYGDLRTEVLSGHIGVMLAHNVKKVLIVGLGSGITLGSVLKYPVEKVDLVEISRCVLKAAGEYFAQDNDNALSDSRVKIFLEDGQAFLRSTTEVYDVVISEPSNPWMRGIGNLFSVEFFSDVKKRLRRGGVLIQWFHTYEMTDSVFKMVLRTYLEVFPNTWVFKTQAGDIILAGFKGEINPCLECLKEAFEIEGVREDLKRIELLSPLSVLLTQVLPPSSLALIVDEEDKRVNSKFHPYLEFEAPRAFWLASSIKLPKAERVLFSRFVKKHKLKASEFFRGAEYFLAPKVASRKLYCYMFVEGIRRLNRSAELCKYSGNLDNFFRLCIIPIGGLEAKKLHRKGCNEISKFVFQNIGEFSKVYSL
jgi:spermidine synthase